MLSIDQVSVSSKEKKIVDHVSLSIREGEWYALVGQSGSGKTLLSQAIGRMLPANLQVHGNIRFNEQDLMSLTAKEMRSLRGKKISYIFQDYQGSFTPFRTIGQHFDEYQKVHDISDASTRLNQAVEALHSVGLEESLLKRYPFQLSGGQLQRVSIATALLLSPDLIIADEITTALDSISGHKILELLARRQKESGFAILFITHDWRHVRRYANHLAVMKEGQIVEAGQKDQILSNPQHEYTKELIKAAPTLQRSVLNIRKGVTI
ncbi:dipeptide/oligopeptide/nickel ABC transporter ATP-binding protein [Paenibacillus sp. FSL H7-0326]|uniref:ABC transporter ATP-binding protein n=1 Tax=Paenibacillus sp. FSL H7-0326 TaxID=1921144 RepID=UPI00096BDB71|nr:ABC transporter ATP-binding protein [Paenibacillus sp. FSL H7-0326]OMC68350.1 dipeptide/oligopeptide/nickel ABC transporter ATP-binding protein [Paenibacillus sp. FSL H7-0326]